MKELGFREDKITGGWEFVKSYGNEADFWEGIRDRVLKRIKMVLGKVLLDEVKGVVGCDRYERSKGRRAYRNGSYERGLLTEYGWIEGISEGSRERFRGLGASEGSRDKLDPLGMEKVQKEAEGIGPSYS